MAGKRLIVLGLVAVFDAGRLGAWASRWDPSASCGRLRMTMGIWQNRWQSRDSRRWWLPRNSHNRRPITATCHP